MNIRTDIRIHTCPYIFFLLLLGNLCTSYGKKSMRLTDCICGEAGARFAGEAVCLMISLHLYIYP